MVYVPSGLITLHQEIAIDFINTHGQDTILVYKKKVVCNSCSVDTIGNKPGPGWTTGGTIPMNVACPECDGTGFKWTEVTDTIKQRVYFTPKDWVNINGLWNVQAPDNRIQTRTLIGNLRKIETCDHCVFFDNIRGYGEIRMTLDGKPIPWGMNSETEIVCMWKPV